MGHRAGDSLKILRAEDAGAVHSLTQENPLNRAKIFVKRALAGVLGLAILLYAGDTAYVHYEKSRPGNGGAFGAVRILPLYTVPQKDGREEIYLGDAETDTCVHAIFPHFGYAPCWYLNRKKNNMVPMILLPPD